MGLKLRVNSKAVVMVILDYGATDNVKNRDKVHRNGSECQADDMKQEADSETR